MAEMISIEFEYRKHRYHALVRCREMENGLQVRVTVMNGDLEALLFGHHIFRVDEGEIVASCECQDRTIREIQQCIASALSGSSAFSELYMQHTQHH